VNDGLGRRPIGGHAGIRGHRWLHHPIEGSGEAQVRPQEDPDGRHQSVILKSPKALHKPVPAQGCPQSDQICWSHGLEKRFNSRQCREPEVRTCRAASAVANFKSGTGIIELLVSLGPGNDGFEPLWGPPRLMTRGKPGGHPYESAKAVLA